MKQNRQCGRLTHIFWLMLAVIAVTAGAAPLARADWTKDEAFEKQVMAELTARDPDAARIFGDATSARDRGDLSAAREGFKRVTEMLPQSDHAFRRLCGVELAVKEVANALPHCRTALQLESSAYNRDALAQALIASPQPSTAEIQEAASLAQRALDDLPNDPSALGTVTEVDLTRGDLQSAKKHALHFRDVAPNDPHAHLLLTFVHASEGDFDTALGELAAAKRNGLSDEAYQSIDRAIRKQMRSGPVFWAMCIAALFAAWAAVFAILLGLGAILSSLVLRATERISGMAPGEGQRVELAPSSLRRIYKSVIAITCVYFYASLPIVLLSVFIAAAGLIYGMLAMGYIVYKLVFIVLIVVLVSLVAVFKAIGAIVGARKREDPGDSLDLEAEPKLRAVLQEVADRVGTRRVDRVFVTTGTELAVTERGGGWFRFRKRSERYLIVGAAVLEGMPIRAFKAVLAHEYGHFKNEDTAGGGFALTMKRSLVTMAIALARGGAAQWYNPAWWFVRGFERVFVRISHGASRLQEILADRWAATAYGSASFERGLRHVIDRTVRFDAHANVALKEVIEKRVPLANFYKYTPETPTPEQDLAQALEKALARPASEYDSHPPPNQRIAWANALRTNGEAGATDDDDGEAWSLFHDRTKVEEQMTRRIHASLSKQGIILPMAS